MNMHGVAIGSGFLMLRRALLMLSAVSYRKWMQFSVWDRDSFLCTEKTLFCVIEKRLETSETSETNSF